MSLGVGDALGGPLSGHRAGQCRAREVIAGINDFCGYHAATASHSAMVDRDNSRRLPATHLEARRGEKIRLRCKDRLREETRARGTANWLALERRVLDGSPCSAAAKRNAASIPGWRDRSPMATRHSTLRTAEHPGGVAGLAPRTQMTFPGVRRTRAPQCARSRLIGWHSGQNTFRLLTWPQATDSVAGTCALRLLDHAGPRMPRL